jgi:transcriptional regulator with XRE-family HTH domain
MAERWVGDDDSEEFRALKKAIGKHLRELRTDRGFSAREVAEMAQVSPASYGMTEAGVGNPTLKGLDKIARALAVPRRFWKTRLPRVAQGSKAC